MTIPADDTVFQIKPLKPVEELRREALLSKLRRSTVTFMPPIWWN